MVVALQRHSLPSWEGDRHIQHTRLRKVRQWSPDARLGHLGDLRDSRAELHGHGAGYREVVARNGVLNGSDAGLRGTEGVDLVQDGGQIKGVGVLGDVALELRLLFIGHRAQRAAGEVFDVKGA